MKIEVSNGEIADKLTIIEIKLERIKDEAKLINLRNEFKVLDEAVAKIILKEDALYQELLDINKKLWDIEDRIRELEKAKTFNDEFIEVARSVYFTNDQRSDVKRRINEATGSKLNWRKVVRRLRLSTADEEGTNAIDFRAMGDVIMLLPVLKGVLSANKDVELYLLTRKFLFPFFEGIENLHLIEADFKGKHKGTAGVHQLYKELKQSVNPDLVIDLHQVLRTYLLNFFFKLSGTKVCTFDKGSADKKQQVKQKSKDTLPNTVTRYKRALHRCRL